MQFYCAVSCSELIQDRQAEIDTMYAEADEAKNAANAMQQEYAEKLNAAGETGERIVKEAVERGRLREEEIIRQANAEAGAIMEKANAAIAQEKKKAVNDAKNEISDMAMSIAEKIVGRELTGVDQNKLVDEFIDELGGNS